MPTRRIIGVDIGETRLLAGAVDASLAVHHRTRRALSGSQQTILLDAALDAIDETRDAAGADVAAVGFAIRSFGAQGSDAFAPARIAHQMAERIGLPVFADAAANAVALAEHRAGAARGTRDVVAVMIDRDLEAGAIVGGELVNSVTAPAIGWEEIGDLARLTEFAHDGDRDAAEALFELGERIGRTMASFVQLYQPQVLVLSGSPVAAGELLLGPVRSGLAAAWGPPPGDEVPIVIGSFGADAGIAGAAALALERLEHGAA